MYLISQSQPIILFWWVNGPSSCSLFTGGFYPAGSGWGVGLDFFKNTSVYNSWPGAIGATGSWFGWRAHMGWGRGDYIQCNPEVTKSYWLNVDIPPAGDNCWTCRDDLHQGLVATMYSIPYMVNDIALVSLCRSWCGICSQDEDDAVLTLGLCLHDLSLDVTWWLMSLDK